MGMVPQLVQGGLAGAGGGLVIGRQRQRGFRHDVPAERGRGVAQVAGEFGAELARRSGWGWLRPARDLTGRGVRRSCPWYVFAVAYARDRWVGRAARTWNSTCEALTLVTRSTLRDIPGWPGEWCCTGCCARGRSWCPARRRGRFRHRTGWCWRGWPKRPGRSLTLSRWPLRPVSFRREAKPADRARSAYRRLSAELGLPICRALVRAFAWLVLTRS